MKMRRSQWLQMQAEETENKKRLKATRKGRPKAKSGLRPFRKETQSYVDWMKDMLGMAGE